MDEKETFTLLYDSLRDIIKTYIENVMKTLAFIIIALGWIVTSDTARGFIEKQDTFYYYLSLIAVVVIALIHTYASITYYYQSQKKMHLLNELNIASPEHYDHYEITSSVLITNLILNSSLFALLFAMIFSLR